MNVNNLTKVLFKLSIARRLIPLVTVGILCIPGPALSAELEYEDLSHVRTTAEHFALTQIDKTNLSNIEANTNTMDSRLRLAKCDQDLEAFSNSAAGNIRRMTIGIRCSGTKPWNIYVPVSISALANVAYTARPLTRGELILRADIELRQIPLTQIPGNYISEAEHLVGMELTRALRTGVVISMNNVKVPQLIQRGQEVIILAKSSNIQVRMNGVALRSGAAGDFIPIRNSNSGRTVEAKVIDSFTVEVNM